MQTTSPEALCGSFCLAMSRKSGTGTITTGVQQIQERCKENGSQQKLNIYVSPIMLFQSQHVFKVQWQQTDDTRGALEDVANSWHAGAESRLGQLNSELKFPREPQENRQ